MPLDWMDVSDLSFYSLLLFERVQLSWFPGWNFPEPEMSLALEANTCVAWYIRHKCPEVGAWLEGELARAAASRAGRTLSPEEIREVEVKAMGALVDLLVYALDPAIYDRLPFLGWDSRELTALADFRGRRVLDIGSGTGRLAFAEITLGGHVFGDDPEGEYAELACVTCPGGKVILFPGSNDVDNPVHSFLVERGFAWSTLEEPQSKRVRVYWKTV